MNPLVSIILPCYNIEKYIKRCVESIQNQTYPHFEALFIDDGSTDNTVEVFNDLGLDSRFKMYSKKNEGSGFARNYGLERAQGEYVYFMDPDDVIEPDLLKDNVEVSLNEQSDLNIFGFRRKNEDTNGIENKIPNEKMILDSKIEIQKRIPSLQSENVNISAVWNKFYERSFLTRNGIKFTNLPIGQDFEFNWLVYDHAEKITVIPESYYTYYVGRPGSARTEYNATQYQSEKKILGTLINKSQKWNLELEYQDLINSYKLDIVLGEVKNLNKHGLNAVNELQNDSLYNEVQKMSYKELPDLSNKKILFYLKHPLILKMYLKYKER